MRKAYGLTLLLKDDPAVIERYKHYHREAWPEVIARLKEIGITEMKIYMIGRRLFMYMEAVEAFDPDRDVPKLNDLPRYREWDVLMSSMQERVPEAREGEWWAAMEEVFDLNW
ncbi:MAG TPA: L-rhamnose mutarotase [Verrucomicrobiae bacterium]|nr:L-rhamnose mutarotase [Verrucomicrobiae bacterium]